MGDFLVDFREREERAGFAKGAAFLKFQGHVQLEVMEFREFSLALTSVDNSALWGPFIAEDVVTAVCGRIDLEENEWQAAEKVIGRGGLASKHLAQKYRENGASALETLSGNFALLLWDRKLNVFFLVGDLCGALPLFKSVAGRKPAFSSHPDALAICIGEEQNWNEESLAEFIFTSGVTPPYTYYTNIRSLAEGTIISCDLTARPFSEKAGTYFSIQYRGNDKTIESELAEELAQSLVSSVRKRTLPRLGPVAVALSGGLDSRTILAAAQDRSNIFAFCCFNEENFEFASARAVARALDVKLVPLTRDFDYYGDSADLGIRISGGMGTFANNHFLGVSQHLRDLGAQNLLTGCYCDYLFKGLPLNTTSGRFFRNERLASYAHEFYFAHYRMHLLAAKAVRARLDDRFPESLRNARSAPEVFQLEKLRTFPLFQEPDNAQRLIPQRVLFSYLPVADRAVLETYCKIPYHYKLNRSLFKKTVEIICGAEVCRIADANTGAPANASAPREAISSAALHFQRKLKRLKGGIATDTSWPDWTYYIAHSAKLKTMWERPCEAAADLFRRILPAADVRPSPADYSGHDQFLFVQLLSLKLWLQQR